MQRSLEGLLLSEFSFKTSNSSHSELFSRVIKKEKNSFRLGMSAALILTAGRNTVCGVYFLTTGKQRAHTFYQIHEVNCFTISFGIIALFLDYCNHYKRENSHFLQNEGNISFLLV